MKKIIPRLIIAFAISLSFALMTMAHISCTRAAQREIPETDRGERDKLVRDYVKEGFVSNNIFRIVIIQPREGDDGAESIERSARQRAFVSLQKYLSSRNMTINQNTRAKLLNLTEECGLLKLFEEKCDTRKKVYLFEIKRTNLKQYVDTIAENR
jgi:hypothetical protein